MEKHFIFPIFWRITSRWRLYGKWTTDSLPNPIESLLNCFSVLTGLTVSVWMRFGIVHKRPFGEINFQCFAPNVCGERCFAYVKIILGQYAIYLDRPLPTLVTTTPKRTPTKSHNWCCSLNQFRCVLTLRRLPDHRGWTRAPFSCIACCSNRPGAQALASHENVSNQFFMQSHFGLNSASVFHSLVSDLVQH